MYGAGTEATINSICTHCQSSIRFGMAVTGEVTVGRGESVHVLREWDPVPTAEDRAFPHFIDHF